MSEANTSPQQLVTELKVSAHLMLLQTGLYCVYHAPGSTGPDAATGLPGARITLPPGPMGRGVTISGFREDGWLGLTDSAALIRVAEGPAQVLMTIYQMPGSPAEAPKLQVLRLVEGVPTAVGPAAVQAAQQTRLAAPETEQPEDGKPSVEGGEGEAAGEPEISAHIQIRGDVLARVGEWVGDRGSRRWVEGFALAPRGDVALSDIEYQAVLGRGWLSPWTEGGQYCGSRGMALPILGLRVRLRGAAAETHRVELSGTFTDGTEIGPVTDGEACEAASLAPLEAFQIKLIPIAGAAAEATQTTDTAEAAPARRPGRRAAAAPKAKPVPASKPVAAPKAAAPKAAAPKIAAPKAPAPKAAAKSAKSAPAAKPVRPATRVAAATRTAPKPAAGKPGKGRR